MRHEEFMREMLKHQPTQKQLETQATLAHYNVEMLGAAVGVSSESGELLDEVKKHVFHGKELDKEALILEMGDVYHYLSKLAYVMGISLETIRAKNVQKLESRSGTQLAGLDKEQGK